ncbi:LysR family transcriptional regulator [Angustibacter luteus]|uniref:LysR family transcriptional regulator n=1 Tax=Angustibacter luteus TaxID=658456 RepID=A0ABW1JER4_9ACTN
MDVALLHAFVQVSEIGSISEAAPALGYSQPGLSQRIQTLERRLGCRLFERGPLGVRLTDRGEAVLPYARIMIGVADALRAEARRD